MVTVHQLPKIYSGGSATIFPGSNTQLSVTGTGTSYSWSPDINLSCASCTTIIANPSKTTTYTIVATDDNGCRSQATATVFVKEFFTLYIPNAFTPNKDGHNTMFYAYGTGVEKFEFFIYNRWGELIFESHDISKGWDGSFKGQPAQQDVYFFIAKAVSEKGEEIKRTGTITIVN
jgi:gliding motility-associated-like protein